MDISYLLWLQGIRESLPSVVEHFFVVVSAIAASNALVVLPCLLYWCIDKRAGQFLLFSFSLGTFINQFVKNTVCCYRPWIRSEAIHPAPDALPEATGYSFPSGHTQAAASLIGGVGTYFRKRWKVLFVLCWVFVLLVGFSRSFLGVHTPQDVIVGLVEAILIIALVPHLLDWADAKDGRDATIAVASVVLCVGYLVYVTLKPYPLDYDAAGAVLVDPVAMQVDCYKAAGFFVGAALGWFAERRLIGFEVDSHAPLSRHVLRFVLGMVIVAVFHVAARPLQSMGLNESWYEFIKSFLTVIAAAFVAPAAFTAAERKLPNKQAATTGPTRPE